MGSFLNDGKEKIIIIVMYLIFVLIIKYFVLSFPFLGIANARDGIIRPSRCTENQYRELMKQNFPGGYIKVDCLLKLQRGDRIVANILFEGTASTGAVLDCGGATIDVADGKSRMQKTGIIVRSRQRENGVWEAPEGVLVRNCKVHGFIRVYGIDENANGANMKMSSRHPEHTKFAQSVAPKRTTFDNMTIVAPHGISLYVGPGVTGTKLRNSLLKGTSVGTVIYLDAESGRNIIADNVFDVKTERRELIAIDGSARNEIVRNIFHDPVNGGVFVYRNCGEGGVIRHQRPILNIISKNKFVYVGKNKSKPAVWLNSRNGKQKYCFLDYRYRFGSSESPLDFAQNNIVSMNRIVGGNLGLIRNNDASNDIYGNVAE